MSSLLTIWCVFMFLQETYLMKHMSKHTVVEHLVSHQSPQRTESPSIPIRISLIWAPRPLSSRSDSESTFRWSSRGPAPTAIYIRLTLALWQLTYSKHSMLDSVSGLPPFVLTQAVCQKWAQRYFVNVTIQLDVVRRIEWQRMSCVRFNKHFRKRHVKCRMHWPSEIF